MEIIQNKNKQILNIQHDAIVFVDYANMYSWFKGVNKTFDPNSFFKNLKKYEKIKEINFYYGKDNNEKSDIFLESIKKAGYFLHTKPVKYIKVCDNPSILQRKCDFDIEICMSVYEYLEREFNTFIFFSGDGDFCPLYEFLIKKGKQVIVVYEQGRLGKEIWNINKGLFKTRLSYLMDI